MISLVIQPFWIKAQLADYAACGGYNKKFKVSATLTVEKLDCDGFVVENLSFIHECRQSFRVAMYKASCEELAQGITNIGHRMIGDRLESMMVRIFNLTGYIELNWVRGQGIPAFPRCATSTEKIETRKLSSRKK
ncbi:MAG: hypothetical protein QG640_161 [Patescibacteria group bacterium]|nr:hypothetical protein [Patescibacteria group bacterium]